jgi:hypothetical protein
MAHSAAWARRPAGRSASQSGGRRRSPAISAGRADLRCGKASPAGGSRADRGQRREGSWRRQSPIAFALAVETCWDTTCWQVSKAAGPARGGSRQLWRPRVQAGSAASSSAQAGFDIGFSVDAAGHGGD